MNYLYKCTNHYGVGVGASLRAPEVERLYRLCLVHSRSSNFTTKLAAITAKIDNENKESYIMGDFNIDLLKFQSREKTKYFIESMLTTGYLPMIVCICTHIAHLAPYSILHFPLNF